MSVFTARQSARQNKMGTGMTVRLHETGIGSDRYHVWKEMPMWTVFLPLLICLRPLTKLNVTIFGKMTGKFKRAVCDNVYRFVVITNFDVYVPSSHPAPSAPPECVARIFSEHFHTTIVTSPKMYSKNTFGVHVHIFFSENQLET